MLKRKMVLIVDDEKTIGEVLSEFFDLHDYETYCAYDGLTALGLLKKKHFDIVVTDYTMPEMDGIDLTKIVKSLYPHIFIIGISGNIDGTGFLEAGAHAFLPKPISFEELELLLGA